MPTDIEPQKALHMAANVEVTGPAGAALTDAEKANLKAVKALHDKREGAKSLEALATGFNHTGSWRDTAKRHIQTDFDPTTGDRVGRPTNNEIVNLTDTENTTTLYVELLSKGYDGLINYTTLPPTPDTIKQGQLRAKVESFIMSHTALRDSYKDTAGHIPPATLESILRDQEFLNKFADRLNDIYNPTKRPDAEDADVVEAKNDYQAKDDALNELQAPVTGKLTQARARLLAQEARKTVFDAGDQLILDGLASNSDVVQYKILCEELKTQEKLVAASRYGGGITATSIRLLKSDIFNLENTIPDVRTYKNLTATKEEIIGEIATAKTDIATFSSQAAVAKADRLAAKVVVEGKESQRMGSSQYFAESVQNAMADSMSKALVKRAVEIIGKYPTLQTDVDKERIDEAQEKIKTAVDARWKTLVTYEDRNWLIWKYRKTLAPADQYYKFDLLQTSLDQTAIEGAGHPDSYIKNILESIYPPPTVGTTHPTVELLMGDKKFMQTQRVDLVKKLLVAQAAAEGEPSPLMVSLLSSTSWGKEVSKEWLASADEETKKEVQRITGKPVDENSLEEINKKSGYGGVLNILLLAFGITSATVEIV